MDANLVPEAWAGQFPCQVRVEAVGAPLALKGAARTLKAAGIPLRRLRGAGLVPRGFNFPATVTTALLSAFRPAG